MHFCRHRSVTGRPQQETDNSPMTTAAPAAERPAPNFGSSRRRIAANFLSLAGTSVFGLLITILIMVYVRRILGPAAIGQVSWAMAVISYLTAVVAPGLATVGQRELARSPERGPTLVALVLTVQTLLAVVAYGLVIAVAVLEPRGPTISLLLAIQGVGLFFAAWNNNWVLQAHERMAAPSLAALALNALQLPVLVIAIAGPADILLYAALALPFTFAGVAFNFWYLSRKGLLHPLRLRPTLRGAGPLLRDAWPLALAGAAVIVIANSGTFVLGFTHGTSVATMP
jgi:O-antigen/teichoic acid export membrane protein